MLPLNAFDSEVMKKYVGLADKTKLLYEELMTCPPGAPKTIEEAESVDASATGTDSVDSSSSASPSNGSAKAAKKVSDIPLSKKEVLRAKVEREIKQREAASAEDSVDID